MSRPPYLDEDDFPLASVGTLVVSPNRIDPIAAADTPAIAAQLVIAMNRLAREERPRLLMAPWLAVH